MLTTGYFQLFHVYSAAMLFKRKPPLSPNFLASLPFKSPSQELEAGAFLFFIFLLVVFLFPFQQFQMLGLGLLGTLVLIGLLVKIEWGIYALGLVSFFHGWEFAFADYRFTRNISFLNSLNAPLVDFIAFALLVGFAITFVLKRMKKETSFAHLELPTFLYICFLLVAWWSAMHTKVMEQSVSLKYFERPLIFLYFSCILLPHLFIQSKVVLHRFLKLWFWVGVAIALFGLSSLFVVQSTGWVRIQPYGIGSFAPLGFNHNLIAEVLVALLPLGLWLMWEEKSKIKKRRAEAIPEESGLFNFYVIGTGLMLLVTLGTLSRAAWVTLFVQALALLFLFREQGKILFEKVKHLVLPAIFFVCVILSYMALFLTSNVVSSSDSARVEVTKIVLFYAERAPWFGYGPGSFIPVLTETYVHTIEFGDPLDAHGMIQKVLLEEGIVGLALFGLFLFSILLLLFRKQKQSTDVLPKMLFVMVLGAMVFQLFNTSYFTSVMWMPLGVALTSLAVLKKED